MDNIGDKANEAFYTWEKTMFGDSSKLSDIDREIWTSGWIIGFFANSNTRETGANNGKV